MPSTGSVRVIMLSCLNFVYKNNKTLLLLFCSQANCKHFRPLALLSIYDNKTKCLSPRNGGVNSLVNPNW